MREPKKRALPQEALRACFVRETAVFTAARGEAAEKKAVPVPIRVDGRLDEQPWLPATPLPDRLGGRPPEGTLDLLWDGEYLYLGMLFSEADTLKLEAAGRRCGFILAENRFRENGLNAQAACEGGSLELRLPLRELGVSFTHFGQSIRLVLLLEGPGGIAGFFLPVEVELSPLMAVRGDNASPARAADAATQGEGAFCYAGDAQGTAGRVRTAPEGGYILYDDGTVSQRRARLFFTGQTGFSAYDGMLLEQDITLVDMPLSEKPNAKAANFWIWPMGPVIDKAGRMVSFRHRIQAVGPRRELVFIFSDRFCYTLDTVPLGRRLGDTFRLGLFWDAAQDVCSVYVDGNLIKSARGTQELSGDFDKPGYVYSTSVGVHPGQGAIQVHVGNIRALSCKYGNDKLLGNALSALSFESIRGANGSADAVTAPLALPASLPLPPTVGAASLCWYSSDEGIVSGKTGAVTRPAGAGRVVLLTVTAEYAYAPGPESRTFTLFVPGLNADAFVLCLSGDANPYAGSAQAAGDIPFTLDRNHGSVVLDMGESRSFNEVRLYDSDALSRVSAAHLSLYVGGDNESYERITGWSLLKTGNAYQFYNLEAQGRYVKVHCHLDDRDDQADFVSSLQSMLEVADNPFLFGSAAAFSGRTTAAVSNRGDSPAYDKVFHFSLDELSVPEGALRSDRGDIRFVLDGRVLYHYREGERFAVRVPELPAGGSAELEVHYGSADALDISNGDGVYEIRYGTRTVQSLMIPGAFKGYPILAGLPDGRLLSVVKAAPGDGGYLLVKRESRDGGRTWSSPEPFLPRPADAPEKLIYEPGGFLLDEPRRLLFLFFHMGRGYQGFGQQASDVARSDMRIYFIRSEDLGQSWSAPRPVQGDRSYFLTYTDLIRLSTYDGGGPGVDYVGCFGALRDHTGAFCCSTLYSTDGGESFRVSDDIIRYEGAEAGDESGLSEGALYELPDGRLYLIVRNQLPEATRLAQAVSHDGGRTWTEAAEDSAVYSPNTQPILGDFNGVPLLLWGGNNIQGGNSYQRFPMNIAYSNDGCQTFRGIQDLYLYTSLNAVEKSANHVVNPHMQFFTYKGADEALFTWFNQITEPLSLQMTDFEDFLYKTKGAFDSFESGNPKYEGWLTAGGQLRATDKRASEGSRSLLLENAVTASRSIPYFTEGSVSVDLFFDALAGGFDVELQAAYSKRALKTSPLSLHIDERGRLLACENDEARALTDTGLILSPGWNRLALTMDLPAGEACVSLNGGAAAPVPVKTELGGYVCFVLLRSHSGTTAYADRFICGQITG